MSEDNFVDNLRKLCSKNDKVAYANNKVTLITYEERHVKTYHGWMLDEETRRLTCSELMTLDEEYDTRKQWAKHEYSGTFLIMDSDKFVSSNGSELDALVGDTNFVQYVEYVELLIMIGDKECRQKGLATDAVRLMISHISNFLNNRVIQASVCHDNIACIKLLEKLGFEEQPDKEASDDKVFVLSNEKRLEILATTSQTNLYTNEIYVKSLLDRSRDYYKSLQ
ncbi:N-acetyltransferase 9 [Aphelenchoides bicaudatus]|nr:N-acetyltransferase 9 [Aphelenchoides bicaudatus]